MNNIIEDKKQKISAQDCLDKLFAELDKYMAGNGEQASAEFDSLKNPAVEHLYPFSNEELESVFKFESVKAKNVLVVGSSGDQALMSILYGAKSVTLADLNPQTKFYLDFKLSAIKNLNLGEFLDFFTYDNIFSREYYDKISKDLNPESRVFWDKLIMEDREEKAQDLLKQILFFGKEAPKDRFYGKHNIFTNYRRDLSIYSYISAYEELKQKLKTSKINYVNANIKDFGKIFDNKFDIIMLSNVFDYIEPMEYYNALIDMKNILNPTGTIQGYYSLGTINKYAYENDHFAIFDNPRGYYFKYDPKVVFYERYILDDADYVSNESYFYRLSDLIAMEQSLEMSRKQQS